MKQPIPFGKYYLLERINVGGMAEVFRAKAYGVEGFERLVAVKRILPNIAEDKEFIRMFIDEAKLAVQLNHANIAQIFDLGMVEASYYIALEHIHGRDLRAIFDRCRAHNDPMPIAQACFVVMKACEGLDYAHNKRDQAGREIGLVHRDVSPQNVLVSFEGEVKLIDFGIAKAAGKGSKTQAGILKGKFGYMSPEQVRGLPVDRRSDIFSCGIVLYELLTGERLFIGESDFSTLEKVRNVEILPPSTYNRRIPDELERIVLKALAKDPEDRYQNAIDLHDELQAFVYTAGEFYSRKDLAAWMKRVFAQEIDDEAAKIESFRRLPPPEVKAQAAPPSTANGRPKTQTLGAVAQPPPTPHVPPRRSPSQWQAESEVRRTPDASPVPIAGGNGAAEGELEWDDDELETQIYDDQEPVVLAAAGVAAPAVGEVASAEHSSGVAHEGAISAAPARPARAATAAPVRAATAAPSSAGRNARAGSASSSGSALLTGSASSSGSALSTGSVPRASTAEPDLSSLVDSARGWDDSRPPRPRAATLPPPMLANGSTQTSSPFPRAASIVSFPAATDEPLLSELERGDLYTAPVAASAHRPRRPLIIGGAAAAVLLVGGVAAALLVGDDEAGDAAASKVVVASDEIELDPVPAQAVAEWPREVLDHTGFDLIVDPPQSKVKLDGELVDLRPPMSIRNLTPGLHTVEIEGPAGFFSNTRQLQITAGQVEKVQVGLEILEITGRFTSEPPGAVVTLLTDGVPVALGAAPVTHPLDPRKRYEVTFDKPGYVTVTKPVAISGRPQESVTAVLERATARSVASAPRRASNPIPPTAPAVEVPTEAPRAASAKGTLLISAKPPCAIYIDGKNTGLKTPQRDIKLSAGNHRITLVNEEHGIKESFSVGIEAGEQTKSIKDFMDRLGP